MNKFDNLVKQLLEDMTTGSVLGPGQAHPTTVGQSSDFYAPGDARIPGVLGMKKVKKKKLKKESIPLIRRTFPGM
jgi:hypothetical protein